MRGFLLPADIASTQLVLDLTAARDPAFLDGRARQIEDVMRTTEAS